MYTGDVYECVTTWNHDDKAFVVVRRQQQLRYRPKSNDDISLMCLVRQFDCVMCWIDLLRHTVRHNLYVERIINKNNQRPQTKSIANALHIDDLSGGHSLRTKRLCIDGDSDAAAAADNDDDDDDDIALLYKREQTRHQSVDGLGGDIDSWN